MAQDSKRILSSLGFHRFAITSLLPSHPASRGVGGQGSCYAVKLRPAWLLPTRDIFRPGPAAPKRCAPSCWLAPPMQAVPGDAPAHPQPGDLRRAFGSGVADHRRRTEHKQPAQGSVTLLGDAALALLAAAAVLLGHQPDPGSKLAGEVELGGIGDGGHDGRCGDRPLAVNARKPAAGLVLCQARIAALIAFTRRPTASSAAASPRRAWRASSGMLAVFSP